ncbi:MAG: TerB family tellurite resistance protein [Spirochaetes bacterium]|nr:TerB family tellurite resistance protein [Spirochaetota bacterium]
MTKNEAIVDVLANFAFYDNKIQDLEKQKIIEITAELGIKDVNVEEKIKYVQQHANDDKEMESYAKSLAFLNTHLDKNEKEKLFDKIIKVIKADGKILDQERFKADLLAKNWEIKASY